MAIFIIPSPNFLACYSYTANNLLIFIGLYQMLTLVADDEQEYQKLISNLGSSVQKQG